MSSDRGDIFLDDGTRIGLNRKEVRSCLFMSTNVATVGGGLSYINPWVRTEVGLVALSARRPILAEFSPVSA